MFGTEADKKDETTVLVIADNFGDNEENENALKLVELTLEWTCSLQQANIFVVSSPLDESVVDELKRKWKPRVNVEFLLLENCRTVGDVMRAVDKPHVVKKEFVMVDSIPPITAARLNASLAKFKELRKTNKNNVMMLICSRTSKSRYPYVLDRDTNRLLSYNSAAEEVAVVLNKKDFAVGRVVRTDLKPAGIYICGEEVLAQFSDDFDTHSMDYQIRNILEHEEILCQNIHVDVHPFDPPFVDFDAGVYAQFVPFEVENENRRSCVFTHRTRYPLQCESSSPRCRENSFRDDSRESSPDPSVSIWPCTPEITTAPKSQKSLRRRKVNSVSSSVSVSSSTTRQVQHIDAVYETTAVGLQRFDEEVAESMRNLLEAEEWDSVEQQKKLIVEINSSKLAYNISMENVTKHIFLAFMRLPRFGPKLNDMKNFTLSWMNVWLNYYKNPASKLQILHAVQEHAAQVSDWAKYVPHFVVFLHNGANDLVTEECVVDWYENLGKDHPLRTDDLKRVVDWIQESDEEETDGE